MRDAGVVAASNKASNPVTQSSPSPSQSSLSDAFAHAREAHRNGREPIRVPTAASPTRADAPQSVEHAIATAAQSTSIDFGYLVAQAQVESAMNPRAKARTSSATGLYQFIDSTWLATMRRHGERFGLSEVAAQIEMTNGGTAYVRDPAQRQAILAMRNDPQIASFMAAGLAEDNRSHLLPILGRQPDHGELYLAHFLGAGGAGRFLSELQRDPNQSAATLFRRPAVANRSIFYERSGAPRSLAGVMQVMDNKMARALARSPTEPNVGVSPISGPRGPMRFAEFTPPELARPPYLIADESVFGTATQPVVTFSPSPSASGRSGLSTVPLSQAAPAQSTTPMSNVLRSTFGTGDGSTFGSAGSNNIRRVYDQLRSLGL